MTSSRRHSSDFHSPFFCVGWRKGGKKTSQTKEGVEAPPLGSAQYSRLGRRCPNQSSSGSRLVRTLPSPPSQNLFRLHHPGYLNFMCIWRNLNAGHSSCCDRCFRLCWICESGTWSSARSGSERSTSILLDFTTNVVSWFYKFYLLYAAAAAGERIYVTKMEFFRHVWTCFFLAIGQRPSKFAKEKRSTCCSLYFIRCSGQSHMNVSFIFPAPAGVQLMRKCTLQHSFSSEILSCVCVCRVKLCICVFSYNKLCF